MRKEVNKLVRDNIPEIIKNNGDTPVTKILDNDEYYIRLKEKLIEEVNEYIQDDDLKEIADILEVIYAVLKYRGINIEEIE